MSEVTERFRRTLEDAVEAAISGRVDDMTSDVVTGIWNATDDERGRLVEENNRLRAVEQRMRDLAAYWNAVNGGEQVAEALVSVLDGTHRPLPTATAWAWTGGAS